MENSRFIHIFWLLNKERRAHEALLLLCILLCVHSSNELRESNESISLKGVTNQSVIGDERGRPMKFRSVFDIIGPVMIGPSSSHTAGAARIGRVARSLFGREPKRITVSFYGSLKIRIKDTGQM